MISFFAILISSFFPMWLSSLNLHLIKLCILEKLLIVIQIAGQLCMCLCISAEITSWQDWKVTISEKRICFSQREHTVTAPNKPPHTDCTSYSWPASTPPNFQRVQQKAHQSLPGLLLWKFWWMPVHSTN